MTKIQRTYLLPFLLLLSLVGAFYIGYVLNQQTDLLMTEIKGKGNSILSNAAAESSVDVVLFDEEKLYNLIRNTTNKDRDIIASGLYSSRNDILISDTSDFSFPEMSIPSARSYEYPDYFLLAHPIFDRQEEHIGQIGLILSKTRINDIIFRMGLRLGIVGLFTFVSMGYFVFFLTQNIKRLADSAVSEAEEIQKAYLKLQQLQKVLKQTNESLEVRVKERTNELNFTNTELESVNDELKEFAYIVSHDLKAPLRAIHSLTEWIVEDYEEVLDEKGTAQLLNLKKRVEHMNYLIEGILQFSRVGRTDVTPERLSIKEIVEYAWDSLETEKPRELQISTALPDIYANYNRTVQIFALLFDNAVKYNDKSNIIVEVSAEEDEDFYYFSIVDNGKGIPKKDQMEVFKLFKILDRRSSDNHQIGLGLTLVKRIVEYLEGSIEIESEPKRGTAITFTLPKAVVGLPAEQISEAK